MNGQKYPLLIVILLSVSSAAAAELPETVRIVRVRIFIDEVEYEWTSAGLARSGDDEGGGIEAGISDYAPMGRFSPPAIILKPETIVSFLSVRPDQRITVQGLEQRCADTERRLRDSGYVYVVSVRVVPPRRNPTERTVVIEARSGYLWRYGGGNAWGMVGKAGLGGERAAFWGYLGWNRNGIKFLHSRVGGIPLALGGQFYYYGPGEDRSKHLGNIENRFEAIATTGWYITPDLFTGIDTAESGFGFSDGGLFSVQPFVSYRKYLKLGTLSDAGANVRAFWFPVAGISKYESTVYTHMGITKKLTLALNGSGGYSFDDLPENALFDLYYVDDRSIRSGYSLEELRAPQYLFASAELRFNIVTFNVAHTVDCTIQGYAFTDAARLFGIGEAAYPAGAAYPPGAVQKDFVDAFGGGVRVLFDNPVFAYFTFAYGLNHEGLGRFSFCATAGF